MFGSILLVLSAQATSAVAVTSVEEPDPKAMSRSEIREFNASLARDHPYYIRCERIPETGSLVKKLYSCRTNDQWQKADEVGNDKAREMGDHFAPKFLSQSG